MAGEGYVDWKSLVVSHNSEINQNCSMDGSIAPLQKACFIEASANQPNLLAFCFFFFHIVTFRDVWHMHATERDP